jgi:hypothetical protein
MDSIQKCIPRVYNEILKSWNNECIEYKVELGDSIQNHIGWCQFLVPFLYGGHFCLFLLDLLLIWSSRRCCEVADCGVIDRAVMSKILLCSWVFQFAELKHCDGLDEQLPCHCQPLALLLPLHHVPLSCMQLLSCQACHLLPSISSPAPLPHCVPCPLLHQKHTTTIERPNLTE